MAKAITAGCAPIGAAIVTEGVARSVQGKVGFYSTYGWHPLAVDAAIANLRWILKHQATLLAHVNAMSEYFCERLSHIKFKREATLRISGLAIGITLGDSDTLNVFKPNAGERSCCWRWRMTFSHYSRR